MQSCAVWCSVVQSGAVQFSAVQCRAVLCSNMTFSAIWILFKRKNLFVEKTSLTKTDTKTDGGFTVAPMAETRSRKWTGCISLEVWSLLIGRDLTC